MIAPLIAKMCSAICAAALTVSGNPIPYTIDATHAVEFYGTPVGVYVDDTQHLYDGHSECQDVAFDRQHWRLVIAGIAPQDYPKGDCPGAINAVEWGQYWGHLPKADAYILESANLGPLSGPAPGMTAKAFGFHPRLIIYWENQ